MSELMSKRIYSQRKKLNLTMEELAQKVGVSKSTVNKWEKGYIQNIKGSTIHKLSNVLGCSPAWLMGFDDALPDDLNDIEDTALKDVALLKKIHLLNSTNYNLLIKTIDTMLSLQEQ